MGEFWKSYFMDNGQRMSPRQIKKVMKLEKKIENCVISIVGLEEAIRMYSEEIKRVKTGGGKRSKEPKVNFELENIF